MTGDSYEKTQEKSRPTAETATERVLIELWSQILGVYEISALDNFVELGGDSISATLLVNRVRETFGVELPFSRVFDDNATASDLANVIDKAVTAEAGQ